MSGNDLSLLDEDFGELPVATQFDTLIGVVSRAHRDGVLVTLPETQEQVVTDAFIASRLRTVRTRLYLLGYLRSDNQQPEKDRKLRRAIRNFQEEAGLTVDGWVGPETWTALQELVSFEHPANMARWVDDSAEDNLPLRRAVGLRLFALGFLDRRTRDKRRVRRGLRSFIRAANSLNLTDVPLAAPYSLETLSALFDEDGLVTHLASFDAPFTADLLNEDEVLVRRFVTYLAKVELWLLGYGAQLDRDDIDAGGYYPVPARGDSTYYTDPTYSFYSALYRFWVDVGYYPAKARATAQGELTGAFFQQLTNVAEEETELNPAASARLYREIRTAAKEVVTLPERIWEFVRETGSRMWDGIKRAWVWFKKIVGKANPRLSWARNLARLAYQYALNVFGRVRRLVERLVDSFEYVTRLEVPGSTPPDVTIRRSKTFDYTVHASTTLHAPQLHLLAGQLLRQSMYFRIGIRILAVVASALIAVIADALSGIGWFIFVLSLVRAYRDLLPLVNEGMTLIDQEEAHP